MDVRIGCSYFLLFVSLNRLVDCSELYFKLNDGNEIPAIALGTSLGHLADGTRVLPANQSVTLAVQWALQAGYRHVDTAALYRTEYEVGAGVKHYLTANNLPREHVYITTKLWNDAHERDEVAKAIRSSLEQLQMDYIDLYLMHFPFAYEKDGRTVKLTDYLTAWRGMEDARDRNLTRSIGVSNFNLTQMQRLWDNARIKPAVLQIEVNPTNTQDDLVNWCREHDVIVMGYRPFGAILGRKPDAPPPRMDHPVFQELSNKYNKTPAQIILRYLLDRHIVPIPRSTNKSRIEQNINVFDFKLTPEEVDKLAQFNRNYRLSSRTYIKWYFHPLFPFEKYNVTDAEIELAINNIKED